MSNSTYEKRKSASIDILGGMSIKDVCEKYDKSAGWVRLVCQEFGCKPINNRQDMKVTSFMILRELYDLDKTMQSIADDFNLSKERVSAIYRLARKVGIPGLPVRIIGRGR